MIYDSKAGVAFQRKDKCYCFISIPRWFQLDHEIRQIDKNYKPIGPTILGEWEE